jgi:hypothetical protein
MAYPDPFVGNTNCPLCGSPAKLLPHSDSYTHFECRDCKEYEITPQAKFELKNHPEVKHLIAGLAFENSYYKNEPILIESEHILNAKEISTIEKVFKLAYYIYKQTEKVGLGKEVSPISPACCYAKNTTECFSLCHILKENNIITFTGYSYVNDGKPYHYSPPILTGYAKLKFDNGIDTVDKYKEEFMPNSNTGVTINVNKNEGMINTAIGNANQTALQNINRNIEEFQKLVNELKKTIPETIGSDEKQQIDDSLEVIEREIIKPKPDKKLIKTLLTGAKILVQTAEFAAAVSAILLFIETVI